MRTGIEIMEQRGLVGNEITIDDFARVGLPVVVACSGCTMTMALPSAVVDDNDRVYCSGCASEFASAE